MNTTKCRGFALLLAAWLCAALVTGGVAPARADEDVPLAELKAQLWEERAGGPPASVQTLAPQAAEAQAVAPDAMNPVLGWSRIAFYSYRDGNAEIYTMRADGSDTRRLTYDPAGDSAPRISPDYTRIAFQSNRSGAWRIHAMNLDGGGVTQLSGGPGTDYAPDWSPDGKQLLFISDRSGTRDLYLMRAADGADEHPVPNAGGVVAAAWSPQGDRIAVVKQDGPDTGALIVIRPDGTSLEVVRTGMRYVGQPAWSPDGTRIAIDFDQDGDYLNEIVAFTLTTSYYTTIYNASGYLSEGWAGSWSPDGAQFAFTIVRYEIVEQQLVLANGWLATAQVMPYTVDATLIYGTTGVDFDPHWSSADNLPPTTWIEGLGTFRPLQPLTLMWGGYDPGGSGLMRYDVEWSRDGDAWQPALENTDYTRWEFTPPSGGSYRFRVRATDAAGNVEPWTTEPEGDASVKIYTGILDGQVGDLRGHGIPEATLTQTPAALNDEPSDLSGGFRRYLPSPMRAEMTAAAEHYGPAPAVSTLVDNENGDAIDTGQLRIALPDTVNWISDGGFDGAGLGPAWQADGATHTTAEGDPHGGSGAAALGKANELTGQVVLQGSFPVFMEAGNAAHIAAATVYNGGRAFMYNRRDAAGNWLAAPALLTTAEAPTYNETTGVADAAGGAHLFFRVGVGASGGDFAECYVAPGTTACAMQPKLAGLPVLPTLRADAQGGLHALWVSSVDGTLQYAYRPKGGAWSGIETLTTGGGIGNSDLATDAAGNAAVVWAPYAQEWGRPVTTYYRTRGAAGWSAPEAVAAGSYWGEHRLAIAPDGTAHAIIDDRSEWGHSRLLYLSKTPGGAWTEGPPVAAPVFPEQLTLRAAGAAPQVAFKDGFAIEHYELAADGWQRLERWRIATYVEALALETGGGLAIIDRADNNTDGARYRHSVPAATATTYALAQTIGVPAGSHAPTLAFFYRGDGWVRPEDLTVTVAGQPVTLNRIAGEWTQVWADLSPWAGRQVTVRFELRQVAGRLNTRLRLDDVMAGAWLTPVIESVARSSAGQLEIKGANLIDPAARLDERTLTHTTNGDTLTVTLPADAKPGRHTLWVVNAGGQRAGVTVTTGRQVFLPRLSAWGK